MQDLSQMSTEELLRMRNGSRPTAQPAPTRGPVFGPAPAPPSPVQEESIQNDRTRIGIAIQGEERQQTQFEQGNVSEQQSAFLLDRVGGGIDDINFITQNIPGGNGAPSAKDALLYNSLGPNSIVTRGLSADGRKAIEDVQLDILDALLTLGTGAAYNAEQLQGQRAAYFPQFNDSEQVTALKRRRLERLFKNAAVRAGPLGERLEQYRGQFFGPEGEVAPAEPEQATARDENPYGARLAIDGGEESPFDRARYLQERFGVEPGQESRLVGMFNANIGNANATPEMVAGFYGAVGLPSPAQPELDRMAKDLRSGNFSPTTGINVEAAEQEYISGLDQVIDQRANISPEAGKAATFSNSGVQGATFEGFDEIAGVVGAISEGLQLRNPIDGYRGERDLARRYTQRSDEANPKTAIAGRIVGSLPTGIIGSAGRPATIANALRTGAVEGGVIGFNSGDGAQDSLMRGAIGVPTGAAVAGTFQAGGNKIQNALANRGPQIDAAQVQGVVDAGARRGVTVRRPDVDPNVRNQRAAVQQTEQGRSAIAAADQNDIAEIETALIRDLGGRDGTQRTEAASSVQAGVKAARDGLRQAAKVEYRAASAQAGNVTAPPTNAVAMIDQQAAELAANGRNLNAKELTYLEDLKADLTQDGGLSIEGLRAQRTGLRSKLENAGVYSNDFERRVGLVLDDASKDMEAALQPFPEALARYQKADGLWRQQAEFGKKVGDLLLGKDGDLAPGAAADRLMGWAKKDPKRLNRLLSEADAGTQEEVRALVVSQLGRSNNGNFSLSAFLTQTSDGKSGALSPGAVRALFGEDGARAIRDLRILSQAKVDAASARNPSNTGSLVQKSKNSLRRLVLGGFGFAAASDAGGGMGLATLAAGGATVGGEIVDRLGRDRAIRLLLNPDFTGWLKKLPNTNSPQAINRSFAGLRSVASRTPVMMADVGALERALISAVNDNPSAVLAAEDQPREPN